MAPTGLADLSSLLSFLLFSLSGLFSLFSEAAALFIVVVPLIFGGIAFKLRHVLKRTGPTITTTATASILQMEFDIHGWHAQDRMTAVLHKSEGCRL